MKAGKLKIVFMGTPEFSAVHLEEILKYPDEFEVGAVYTQPDKPQGRSKKILPSRVKELAIKKGLKIIQVSSFKTSEPVKELSKFDPDILVIVAYGLILNEPVLTIPKYGAINIHASLLPKYRGPSPIQYSLLNGDDLSGVTSFLLDTGVDTGNILLQKETKVTPEDDYISLSGKLCALGTKCLIETLCRIKETELQFKGIPQDKRIVSYAGKITRETAHIDFLKSANELHNLIRALNSWPVCTVEIPLGKTVSSVKIFKTLPIIPCCDSCKDKNPGEVSFNDGKNLHIRTGNGCLNILEVQVQNKNRVLINDFLNGHKISVGTVVKAI